MQMFSLILGSKSPRRKEILSYLNIAFEVIVSKLDESIEEKNPKKISMCLSEMKGRRVLEICKLRESFNKNFFPLILSADTVVAFQNKVFGTPKSIEEAKAFLEELSGKTHDVHTAFSFLDPDGVCETFLSSAEVTFDKISPASLNLYLKTSDSLDKAGGYGIQGSAMSFISRIKGSYSAVMGLPLSDVVKTLGTFLKKTKLGKEFQGDFRGLFHG